MSATVGTDVEIIEALDFEESKACESRVGPCPNTAAFLFIHTCCGASMLLCIPHTAVSRVWLDQHQLLNWPITCLKCGKTNVPFPRIIPLGCGS